MTKGTIIKVTEKKVPTIISYDPDKKCPVIGENARFVGINGKTNIFNFKLDLGLNDTEFSKNKKYWYYVPDEKGKYKIETFTAKEATIVFLKELLKDVPLPEQIMVGVPAIRDDGWRENFRSHMREIFKDMGFGLAPRFFSEPFAVFQYYRNYENKFILSKNSETVLIIDVGAGTFNTCIIRTNADGSLSRGGATSLPLGLKAELCGGKFIDDELMRLIIEKAGKSGIFKKEDPFKRIKDLNIPILLLVEDLKIKLSKKFPSKCSLVDDFAYISESIVFAKGTLHQEQEIKVTINGNDLKNIIRMAWRTKWGRIIIDTINEAKNKIESINITFTKVDKVLVAGGSSNLPFMVEEIVTVLPTQINHDDVFLGSDPGSAVALGLACECKEQVRRDPNLSVGKVAPCLMTDIYFALKKERHGEFYTPKIKINGKQIENGHIICSPFETNELLFNYEIELPFTPMDRIYFYFSHNPFGPDTEATTLLNFSDDVISFQNKGTLVKKFRMEIQIKPNGELIPTFFFKEKGGSSRKDEIVCTCNEIFIDEFDLKENESFVGIDFGTANSYVSRFISEDVEISPFVYPEFQINKSTMEALRTLEAELKELIDNNVLTQEAAIDFAKLQKLHMIFHSNKIEGNPLTKGETEEVLFSKNVKIFTPSQREAHNLDAAFEWVVENLNECSAGPESFLRQINKMILNGIDKMAGDYRNCPVKISGVDFTPPDSPSVPFLMRQLGDEIKEGPINRSGLEFATAIHTKFVFIHPFADGNGRTARLFMNALLWKCGLPGIIVNYYEKERYLVALESSNKGDLSPLLVFFSECLRSEIETFKSTRIDLIHHNISPQVEQPKYENVTVSLELKHLKDSVKRAKNRYLESIDFNFKEWEKTFSDFLICFEEMINIFNNLDDAKDIGLNISIRNYDMIDMDKYIELCQGKSVSQTWFFTFFIHNKEKTEKFLFFFVTTGHYYLTIKNISKVGIVLFKDDGFKFRKILHEPISITEVYLIKDKFIAANSHKDTKIYECQELVETILSDIVREYFT